MPGHIKKRSKSSYTVVVDLGRDPSTGKRRQIWRSVKGTKRDAEQLLVQLLHQRNSGFDTPASKLTVAEYLSRWLEDYARPGLALSTFNRYEQLVRLHLVPHIGPLRLSKLKPSHIQAGYAAVRQSGLSGRTLLQAHRVLHKALRDAVKSGTLASNPASAVDTPRYQKYEARVLEPAEIEQFLAAAGQTAHLDLVTVALLTGMRQGELLGLRWRDVDLERQLLTVRQSCKWIPKHGFVFGPTKTNRGRSIAISDYVTDLLKEHRAVQEAAKLAAGPAYEDMDLVFAGDRGRPIHPSTVRDVWKKIRELSGFSDLRFHDLRHSHASLLIREGEQAKVISNRLGHSSIATTMDVYGHLLDGVDRRAAAALDRYVSKRLAKADETQPEAAI